MSSPWLPRDPAHSSLEAEDPDWTPQPAIATPLAQVLDGIGEVEVLTSSAGTRAGYYRVRGESGPELFVKVLDAHDADRQLEADRIARFVAARGVGVSLLLDGFPRQLRDGRQVLAYPLVDGRFGRATVDDLHRLGSCLGRLHGALADLPEARTVRAASRERHEFLRATCDQVATGGRDIEGLAPRVVGALRRHGGSLAVLAEDGQVVHGDLNYTNVLFERETGGVTVLDFEEALSAWFPPAADVAFAIERFALRAPDATATTLARALLAGYAEAGGGSHPFREGVGLSALLRALNVRALAVLVARHRRGDPVPESEWEKFLALLDETEHRQALLTEIQGEA